MAFSQIYSQNEEEEDGGYSFELVEKTQNDFMCPICLQLMKDAVETSCGHCMCFVCLKKWEEAAEERNVSVECPSCRETYKLEKTVRSKAYNRLITTTIKVKCLYEKLGCSWQGYISDFEEHLQKRCVFVKCPFEHCPQTVKHQHLELHKRKCIYRLETCLHCNASICRKYISEHFSQCDEFLICCSNFRCKEALPRRLVKEHQLTCDAEEIVCDYADIGCFYTCLRKDMEHHMHDSVVNHTSLLHAENGRTTNQLNETRKELEKTRVQLEKTRDLLKRITSSQDHHVQMLKEATKENSEKHEAVRLRLGTLYIVVSAMSINQACRGLFEEFDENFKVKIANKLKVLKGKPINETISALGDFFKEECSKVVETPEFNSKMNFNFENFKQLALVKCLDLINDCPWLLEKDLELAKEEMLPLLMLSGHPGKDSSRLYEFLISYLLEDDDDDKE